MNILRSYFKNKMLFSLNRLFCIFQEEEPQEVEDESVKEERTEQEIPD